MKELNVKTVIGRIINDQKKNAVRFGKNDYDFDGVKNSRDCSPKNTMRQDAIVGQMIKEQQPSLMQRGVATARSTLTNLGVLKTPEQLALEKEAQTRALTAYRQAQINQLTKDIVAKRMQQQQPLLRPKVPMQRQQYDPMNGGYQQKEERYKIKREIKTQDINQKIGIGGATPEKIRILTGVRR